MKTDLFSGLGPYPALLPMLAAVWGALGCWISGYAMAVGYPVLFCLLGLLWALLCCFLLKKNHSLLLIGLQAAAILLMGLSGGFSQFAAAMKLTIGAYLGLEQTRALPEMTQAVGILGSVLLTLGTYTLLRRHSGGFFLFLLLLPPAACLPWKAAEADTVCVGVLMGAVFLLIFFWRGEDWAEGSRIACAALVPVALAVCLLLTWIPQESYVDHSRELREELAVSMSSLMRSLHLGGRGGYSARKDLRDLDLPEDRKAPIAEVTASGTGAVYLRERDYDTYTGTSWLSRADRTETLSGTGEELGTVSVRSLTRREYPLMPCYPKGEILLSEGTWAAESEAESAPVQEQCLGGQPEDIWLMLPSAMLDEATETARTLLPENYDTHGIALAVAEYVRSAAPYSQEPDSMPGDAEDFVLWFLQDAQEGSCTHYASAAAVLLRALGIPARFVVGYRVDAVAGQAATVTAEDAHAWAEYFDYRSWTWNLLEATPGMENRRRPEEEPEAETTVPTTEPTEPSRPPETTAPTTEPTEPTKEEPPQEPDGPNWDLRFLLPLLLLLIPEAQYHLRKWLRRRLEAGDSRNRRALRLWRRTLRLCRLLRREPPKAVKELAEKAAYSARGVSADELRRMYAGFAGLREELGQKPWYLRLVSRYLYGE